MTWREALSAPDATQIKHLGALIASHTGFFARTAVPEVVVKRAGSAGSPEHASALRGPDWLMIELPTPTGGAASVDLKGLPRTDRVVWWFDPRTGQAHRIGTVAARDTRMDVRAPSEGRGQDWVLVIDAGRSRQTLPGTCLRVQLILKGLRLPYPVLVCT